MMIRLATEADLTIVHGLEQVIFPDDAWPFEKLDDDLRSPFAHFLVSVDEDRIVGYAIAHHLTGNDVADVHNIAVIEEYRGKGVGSSLLDELIVWCEARQPDAIMLEVRADNEAAQSLYASRGFHAIATRPGYYQPAGVDALVMRREMTS